MRIHVPHENRRAAFSDFSTLRPVLKKVHFQGPYGRSAKTMQYMCIFAKERFRLDSPLYYLEERVQIETLFDVTDEQNDFVPKL